MKKHKILLFSIMLFTVLFSVQNAFSQQNKESKLSCMVYFDLGKSSLKPQAQKILDEVTSFLTVYRGNTVLIEGHADSSGAEHKNKLLSTQRAQAVADYLIEQGIDKTRIKTAGHGALKPVIDENAEYGKEQNRSAEIIILQNQNRRE